MPPIMVMISSLLAVGTCAVSHRVCQQETLETAGKWFNNSCPFL